MSDQNKILFLVESIKSIKELRNLRNDITKNNINLIQIIPFMYLFEALILYKLNPTNKELFTGIILWYLYTYKAGSKAVVLSQDIDNFKNGIELTLDSPISTKYTGKESVYSFIRCIYLHLYSNYFKSTKNEILFKTLYKLYDDTHSMLVNPVGLKYHTDDSKNVCYLCGKVIDHYTNIKDKYTTVSGEIDHIIPVVPSFILGILNFPLNYTYSHRECNSVKSNELPVHETNNDINELYIKVKYEVDLSKQFKYTVKDAYHLFEKLIDDKPHIKSQLNDFNYNINNETEYYIKKLNYGYELLNEIYVQKGGLIHNKSSEDLLKNIYQKPLSSKKSYSMLSSLVKYFEQKTQSLHNTKCINSITIMKYLIYSDITGYFKFVLKLINPTSLSGGAKRRIENLDNNIKKYLSDMEKNQFIKNIAQPQVWDINQRIEFLKYRYKCSFLFSLEYFKQSTGNDSINDYIKFIEDRIQHCIEFTTINHLNSAKENTKNWFAI